MRLINGEALKDDNAQTLLVNNSQELVKGKRPQDELTEINHRLNLLIGVLYSNQLISESDLKYIEDSIKKLMKGGG